MKSTFEEKNSQILIKKLNFLKVFFILEEKKILQLEDVPQNATKLMKMISKLIVKLPPGFCSNQHRLYDVWSNAMF